MRGKLLEIQLCFRVGISSLPNVANPTSSVPVKFTPALSWCAWIVMVPGRDVLYRKIPSLAR